MFHIQQNSIKRMKKRKEKKFVRKEAKIFLKYVNGNH